jgi:hypothetical protein
MMRVMPRSRRGYEDYGWLKTYHSFSFGSYYAPENKGYSVLRVLNEDRVMGGGGFSLHEHHDAEILTYVLRGALRHEDTLGNQAVIAAGEVQRIRAGAGIKHSEVNTSTTDETHFIQIWILPSEAGLTPDYAQKSFPQTERMGAVTLIASPDGPLTVHQDCRVYLVALSEGQQATFALDAGRRAYLHVVDGMVEVNQQSLLLGDGLEIEDEPSLQLVGESFSEVLLFDMP